MSQYELLIPKKPHRSYHNTTGLKGANLKEKENAAKGQERIVMEYFLNNPTAFLTRDEVIRECDFKCYPGSIGRALTNLCTDGCLGRYLEKTDIIRPGLIWENSVQHAYKLRAVKKS